LTLIKSVLIEEVRVMTEDNVWGGK